MIHAMRAAVGKQHFVE